MAHHDLKQFVSDFQAIVDKYKRSMIRFNDRNYQVDDTVTMFEGWPDVNKDDDTEFFHYTGRSISAQISYIDTFGCQPGYVNLSISNVGILVVKDKVPE